jgi:hypothetical protein
MKTHLKVICLLCLSFVLFHSNLFAQNDQADDHIIYITLPAWAEPEDVKRSSEKYETLYSYAIEQINREAKIRSSLFVEDKIVVFKDKDGRSILPEKNQSNLSENTTGNELSFTYNSTIQPWSAAEIARLNVLFGDFYPVAKQILGNPLFNISLNVRKDTTIFYAGLYLSSSNEMVVKDTSQTSTICHEMIHAFRDDYVMGTGTFEEGMTRATECEVFNILQDYVHPNGDFHSYTYDHYYDGLNKPNIATSSGNMWTNITLSFVRYQLGGYIWAKNLIEDVNFLKNFNSRLYERTLLNPSTPYNVALLRGIVGYVKPIAEGISSSTWMDRQQLLNSTPSPGYYIYHRLNQNTIDYFYRDNLGNEQPQNGATINWSVYNHSNLLLASGSSVTGSYGWINYLPSIPTGYIGKIKVVAQVNSPVGLLKDSGYFYSVYSGVNSPNLGFFGVVEDANAGTVTIAPLDTTMASQTQLIVNGSFSFPDFDNIRGRFRISVLYNNCQHYSRVITKDASRFFVAVRKDPNYLSSFATIYTPTSPNFCSGGNVVLNATPGSNMNYQWYRNNILIVGANQVNYTVTQQGTYKVSISNSLGCSKTSPGIKIYGPPSAAVSVVGPLEICPPDSLRLLAPASLTNTYQWKLNGVNILGAIGNEFYAKTAGSYKVKVTDVFGCSKTSASKNVIVDCTALFAPVSKDLNEESVFQIKPTPARDIIYITGHGEMVTIYDLNGRVVRHINNLEFETSINISDLDEGLYVVRSNNSTARMLICR